MFPQIRKEVKRLLRSMGDFNHIIIDAAILFGAELDLLCDYIILVDLSDEKRRLLLKHKNLSNNDIELRIRGQQIKVKDDRIDYTIINDGDKRKLHTGTVKIIRDIENREKNKDAKEQV